MSASSKTAIKSRLSAIGNRIADVQTGLTELELQVSSMEVRIGILVAEATELIRSRDDLGTAKEWITAKVKGKSYNSVNRWARAGEVARVLGFTDEDDKLPTVMELEPHYRVFSKVKGRDAAEKRIRELWERSGKDGPRTPDKVVAAVNKSIGKRQTTNRTNNNPTGDNTDNTITVTIDPALVEQITKTLESMAKKDAKKFEKDNPNFKAIRMAAMLQIIRLVGEHGPEAVFAAFGYDPSK